MPKALVKGMRQRFKKLKQDRQSWVADWKSLSEQFLPRRMMLLEEGDKTNDGLVNRTLMDDAPVRAMRVLSAGLQGGLTSPARPWFKLGMQDAELQENTDIKVWLGTVQKRMTAVLSRSNFYSAIHTLYSELGTFGTAAMYLVGDLKTVIRCVSLTAGEYYAATDNRDEVTVLFRLYQMTAEQMVQEFGEDALSQSARDAYKQEDRKDDYFNIVHGSIPNPDYQEKEKLSYRGKLFLSVYWEDKDNEDSYLAVRGFDEQAFVTPRWDVKGGDVYGTSPAMDTLSDAKQLQSQKKTMLKAMHKEADPPMSAPASLRHASIVPGAINYVGVGEKFEAAQNVRSNPQNAMVAVEATKKDISEGLYNDLFKMLAFSNENMTATEVRQRVEEKLILLGPVLERLQSELLDPIIDRIFGIMLREGYFPEPPEIMQGRDLKVEYISLLAQAQKMLGTATIEQFFTFVSAQSQLYQEAMDVYNFDEAAEEYADMLGVQPEIVRGADERREIREQRAAAQQAAAEMEMASQGMEDAKNLSQTDMSGDNALSALTGGAVNA